MALARILLPGVQHPAEATPLPVNDDSSFTPDDGAPLDPAAPVHFLKLRAAAQPLPGWSFCTPTPPAVGDSIDPAWLVFLGITPPAAGPAAQDQDWQALLQR